MATRRKTVRKRAAKPRRAKAAKPARRAAAHKKSDGEETMNIIAGLLVIILIGLGIFYYQLTSTMPAPPPPSAASTAPMAPAAPAGPAQK